MNLYQFETQLWRNGHDFVAGCDEVGRGPLAGPVVAAAVILDPDVTIPGLNDSKQLSHAKRVLLKQKIETHAIAYHVSFIGPNQIDQINIYQASRVAMLDAISHLTPQPTYVLSDAMPLPQLGIPYQDIIKGDQKSATIAAASILAKVARDEYMIEMAKVYPGYGLERNMGYPTKEHKAALQQLGPTPIHRMTYGPVRDWMLKQTKLDI